jgi:23S rRNA pseudouridine1911/1915/1917 synthase
VIEPKIIFQDEDLVVIEKPYGVVVNKAQSVQEETIQSWHESHIKSDGINTSSEFWQKGGVVHRLDRETSGVMILANTEASYNFLKQQFLERKTVKRYQALVHGVFKETEGTIAAPIERHPKNRHKFTIGTDLSRTSITDWKVLQSYKIQDFTFSLVELTPHTGRTHQLRVHMQSIQHPIVSDPIYGWQKHTAEDLDICPRLFLHAVYLEFDHPNGKRVSFQSDLPDELQKVLESLANSG